MEFTLTIKNLKKIYTVCKPAIAKNDEIRPSFNYIKLELEGNKCTAYGSDGYRLHMVEVEIEYDNNIKGELLIPIVKIPKANYVVISQTEKEIIFDFLNEGKISVPRVKEGVNIGKHLIPDKKVAFKISFNPKYMKDAFDAMKSESIVELNFFEDRFSPCLIKSYDDKSISMVLPKRGRD